MAIKKPGNNAARPASIVDAQAMGGIHGAAGYRAQANYVALQLPAWLANGLERLHFEGDEDVDLWFAEGCRERHQVKRARLTDGEVRAIVSAHFARFPNEDVTFVLVATAFADKVDSVKRRHQRWRTHHAAQCIPFSATSIQGRDDLHAAFVDLGLSQEEASRALDWLRLEEVTAIDDHAVDTAAILRDTYRTVLEDHLGQTIPLAQDSLDLVFRAIRDRLNDTTAMTHLDRGAIDRLVANACRLATGHLEAQLAIHLHHDSVLDCAARPDFARLPVELSPFPLGRVRLNHLATLGQCAVPLRENLDAAVGSIVHEQSQLQQLLQQSPGAPIVYWGIPHIPMASLVGNHLRGRQVVPVDKQHAGDARLGWLDDEEPRELIYESSGASPAGVVRVRISVSFLVSAVAATAAVSGAEDVHIYLPAGVRAQGCIRSWRQFESVKTQLTQHAARLCEEFAPSAIHLFPAVPVSIALAIGQVFGGTMFPPVWVYDFKAGRYGWAVELHSGAVRVV